MPLAPEKRDGRTADGRIRAMKDSDDPVRRQAGITLDGFLAEVRTEGRFYLRFCALAPMQVEALATLWGLDPLDNWRIFRRVCRFFAL